MVDLNLDDAVLDIGCGAGLQTLLLGEESNRVIEIDLSKGQIGVAEVLARASMLTSIVRFVQGDVVEVEFDKNSFTRNVSFCMLEHIPEWQRAWRKAHEWLTPGRYLVISVDSLATIEDEEVIKKHKKNCSAVTYFNSQTLKSTLREAGFSCAKLYPILKSDRASSIHPKQTSSLDIRSDWQEEYRLRTARPANPYPEDVIAAGHSCQDQMISSDVRPSSANWSQGEPSTKSYLSAVNHPI
jgi:ubiquinone/menaquinone biosynthesis C-methylase UbiE